MGPGGTVIADAHGASATFMLSSQTDSAYKRGSGNGRFTFVPAGSYTLELIATGGKKLAEKKFQVTDGQTVTVTFE